MIAEILKRLFLLGLMLFSVFQLSVAKPAWAITPNADDLDCVCCETADRLAAALNTGRLDKVAVYFFRPRGFELKDLDKRARREARIIAQAMEDVLTNRCEFRILNRNSEVWAAVLHEEDNRGTLNSQDILDVGTGFGARFIVTGEYWQGKDGYFHLRTRLLNGASGESICSAHVDDSFVSSQSRRLRPLLVGLALLLLLAAGGGAFFLVTKKRRMRERELTAAEIEAQSRLKLNRALLQRDPQTLSKLNEKTLQQLSPAEQQMAALILRKASGLVLETNAGESWLIAPGSQHGLGRGDKWFFSFSDPRVSRAPQAFLNVEKKQAFLVHNRNVSNATLVNGLECVSRPLQKRDEITLGPATRLIVGPLFTSGGLLLEVVEGPDSGLKMACLVSECSLNELFGDRVTGAAETLNGVFLVFKENHFELTIGKSCRPSWHLQNSAFSEDLSPQPGSSLILCDGDMLVEKSGKTVFKVVLSG